MPIDFSKARNETDRMLRWSILEALYLSRGAAPMQGLSGTKIVRQVNQSVVLDQRIENDQHAMDLLADLERKSMVTVTRLRRMHGESVRPDNVFVRIEDKGCLLYRGQADPDPDVWDPRVSNEEL